MFDVGDLVVVIGGFTEYQRSFIGQIFKVVGFLDQGPMGRSAILEDGDDTVILIRVTDLETIFTR